MSVKINPILLERLACPQCSSAMRPNTKSRLVCKNCGYQVPIEKGIPLFTPVPPGMVAATKFVRGPKEGSPWRQANWHFLEKVVASLPKESVILDFGAGHGDFSEILKKRKAIALDVYPYDEVDIVCDLQQTMPFKKAGFNTVVLMNVLEHIQNPVKLMKSLAALLSPGGLLIVTVPFLLKLHQLPYDFYRFSHHQLINIGHEAGLEIVSLEGYYDPVLLMKESAANMRACVLPGLPSLRRKMARVLLEGLNWFMSIIRKLIGGAYVADPNLEKSPYPIGYHVVFQARNGNKK